MPCFNKGQHHSFIRVQLNVRLIAPIVHTLTRLTSAIFTIGFIFLLVPECFAAHELMGAASFFFQQRPQADTLPRQGTVQDTVKQVKKGPIETTILYDAKDSIYFDVIKNIVYLQGEAKVTYGSMTIEAERIVFDMSTNIVRAFGVPDSTGRLRGIPIFTDQGQSYNSDSMVYNMTTQKGIISNIVTQQGEGYIVSNRVKKTPDEAFFASRNIYTTCNYDHPHFGIRASKLKVVPGKYVIAGPFNLELNDVPTPLGFAFGLFPFSDKRTAGILVPTYGETRERGFFLRDGGFYFPVGDIIGVKVLGQLWSLGGWGASIDTDYRVRYRFQGAFNFSYNKFVRQLDDLSRDEQIDYWVRWSHAPQSRGSSRFSANVNAGSTTFNRNNSFNTQDFISASFNSSVSYSKTFEGTPFTAGLNLRLNQNVNTNITTMFPEGNLAMRRIFPFKSASSTGKSNPIKEINFSYSFSARANISNQLNPTASFPFRVFTPGAAQTDVLPIAPTVPERPEDFFTNFGQFLQQTEYGAVHRVPISTNLTLLKHFLIAPNFNYTEYWYARQFNYTFLQAENAVKVDTIPGFARAGEWDTGAGVSTRMYLFFYPKIPKVEGIRHMINPSVSFSYRPDFSDPRYGIYQNVQTDQTGTNFRPVSRFQGGLYGTPGFGRSSNLSFNISNQIEAKVQTRPDSTGKSESKKIPIIQNLTLNSGYNLAADSFNLSNININAVFNILQNNKYIKGLNVNLGGTIDPYMYRLENVVVTNDPRRPIRTRQRRVNELAWNNGGGIGNLNNARIALGTSFSPQKKEKKKLPNPTEEEQKEIEFIENNEHLFVDFNIPWSLNVQYNLTYSKQGFEEPIVIQTLNFAGEVNLTEKWRLGVRSSYDFEFKNFGFTSLNLFRDLHCWQMNLSWVPFGPRQMYNIDISVKSSILRDLKLSKRNTWLDNGPIAR